MYQNDHVLDIRFYHVTWVRTDTLWCAFLMSGLENTCMLNVCHITLLVMCILYWTNISCVIRQLHVKLSM